VVLEPEEAPGPAEPGLHLVEREERPVPPAQGRRVALGVGPRERLAAVYLNSRFRDPRVAECVEAALERGGFRMHAVGEGYADRPGWLPIDVGLPEVVAAADVLVSGAGLGSIAQAHLFGTPFVAIATDQPEQRANLALLPRDAASVFRPDDGLDPAELAAAVERARARSRGAESRPDPRRAVARLHEKWRNALQGLVERSPRWPGDVQGLDREEPSWAA
jgi:hypothetical protein